MILFFEQRVLTFQPETTKSTKNTKQIFEVMDDEEVGKNLIDKSRQFPSSSRNKNGKPKSKNLFPCYWHAAN